jgi:hypothetical protein
MSQIMPQTPTYISYRYDTITISQVAGDAFTFTVYTITDVGGNTFTPLTFQDPADVVQAKTIEIYRLLVTSVFKGCCECGNTEPECSIQYTAGREADIAGALLIFSGTIGINYFTANNQDFTGFWPIIQDGSWIFIFSKTDPTVYGVFQLSNYSDGGAFAQFDISLLAGTDVFPEGTSLCVDVTSVGGSLVQGWQDTLDIDSVLDKDNTVDGAGFDFVFDNNSSFTINSVGGSIQTSISGSSLLSGPLSVDVTSSYIDVITPNYATAGTGWVLAKTSAGHIEYVEAGTGTVTSVALDMPSAFTVTGSPIEDSGTFVVTGAGTDLQYINGLGELATFPVYTVENGLHTKEDPASDFVFHLGGQLIENTLIDTNQIISPTTNNEYQFAIRANRTTAFNGQDTQFPLGVANLGNGGVATFQDYGSGSRPNPSVEIVGDVDLYEPLLELRMEGNLPNPDPVLANRISLLRLRYDGAPANARTAMDFSFRNDDIAPNFTWFPAVQLTAEVTNFTAGAETADFELLMIQGGSQQVKLLMEGKGQLTLNEYGPSGFSDATTNINNSLTYVLGVDGTGKVWKKLATGGGTVQQVNTAGLISGGPIINTGTITTSMATNRLVGRYSPGTGIMQEITIGAGLALSNTGNLTATASGGTVTSVGGEGLITTTATNPFTIAGTVTTSVQQNRLVGRWNAGGTGIMQEITIGTGLTLSATGDLTADGGETYTVNNGLTEDPANNFQLGGALVKNTIVNGAANAYDLTFDELNEFYVNGNNKMIITSTNALGDFSQCYVAPFSAQLINKTAGFANSTITAEAGVASMEATPIKILLNATEMQLRTPAVVALTAVNGQVLTLIDAATGEAEWQTGGSSPLTTKGDLYTFSTADARLPVGTNGQILYADSAETTGLKWGDAPSAGGGSGRSYYLNGSINQGTFAGIAMKQMSPVPVIGVGTDFSISSNGYIQSFITDAGDPNKAVIPAGNWNFELWFSASSGGGSPNFYVELYKYDTVALTLTPIASGSTNPEGITNGTTIDLYFTALSVPQTTLALTDRLAVRVYVNNGGGSRTITLHTQGPHLSQIITDFPSGIVSLNGLTAFSQTFATPGTTGTAPAWLSSTSIHTLNIPFASASGVTAGLISKTEYDVFNAKQDAITGAATTITTSDLTVDRALISNASGKVAASSSVVGYGLATLTDPSAVRYLKINSDNTVALRTAAEMVSDLGLGTGSVSILGQSQNLSSAGASQTVYGSLFSGAVTFAVSDVVRRTPMITSGVMTRLYVTTNSAQPASGSLVCTLRKNSVDQALTITIAAGSAGGIFTDLVNSVSVAVGDQMGMKYQNNATAVSSTIIHNQILLTI